MSQTSEIIVKIPRCWKFKSVLEFFKAMHSYTSTSSDALCVKQIYDLQFAKAKLCDSEVFYNIKPEELLQWVKFTHYGSVTETKSKFTVWLDQIISEMVNECNNRFLNPDQITIGDYWNSINLYKYQLALKTEIENIEAIPVAHEKKKVEERKQAEEREQQRLKLLEMAKAKRLEEAKKKETEEAEWISSKKQYYLRCQYYLSYGFDGYDQDDNPSSKFEDDSNEYDIDEMKSVIRQAHEKKNDELVKYKTFPGCHYFGLGCECDDDNCYWTVDMYRCSCDNYKGFTFSTEGIDWLEDLSLDSHSPRGSQERQW